jgi:ribosomal protein S6
MDKSVVIKEDIDQKDYELAFLVKEEEDSREVLKLISQHKMGIRSDGPIKKIDLAYPIKHHRQAFFGYFRIFGEPAGAKLLEQDLRSNKVIIRFLLIALSSQKAVVEEMAKRSTPKMAAKRFIGAKEKQPVLSNEALEKKIEEMLQ